jgi:hypothetical protein
MNLASKWTPNLVQWSIFCSKVHSRTFSGISSLSRLIARMKKLLVKTTQSLIHLLQRNVIRHTATRTSTDSGAKNFAWQQARLPPPLTCNKNVTSQSFSQLQSNQLTLWSITILTLP